MDKLKMHSPNLTEEHIRKIRDLFPGCVTETKDENGNLKLAVDFDLLKQELSDSIVDGPRNAITSTGRANEKPCLQPTSR
nr:hypothetical protein [Prosthecochloris sp. HL-130-GSB]